MCDLFSELKGLHVFKNLKDGEVDSKFSFRNFFKGRLWVRHGKSNKILRNYLLLVFSIENA